MANETPAASPTGTPVLPPRFVPLALAIPTVLAAIGAAVPAHTLGGRWLPLLAGVLAGLLGIASPGLRK